MKTSAVLILVLALVGLWLFGIGRSQETEKPKFDYIGASRCGKACHSSTKQGRQLPIWQESKHAKAFEALGSDEAKEIGKKRGVDDPQKSGKCLRCHSTGYSFGEEVVAADFVEEGVGCELCHGAGSTYAKTAIMKDEAKAKENGLLEVTEATCTKCHNADSPTWDEKVPFDFKAMYEKIKHPKPE